MHWQSMLIFKKIPTEAFFPIVFCDRISVSKASTAVESNILDSEVDFQVVDRVNLKPGCDDQARERERERDSAIKYS